MEALDMKTIMFANVVVNIVCVIVLFILWYQNRDKYSGISLWVLDWILLAGGTLLITQQGTIPDWESVVLSNSMIIGGTLILYFGLRHFSGKRDNPILISIVSILFVVYIAIHTYYTYVDNDLFARSINSSTGLLIVCLMGAWLMLKEVGPQIRRLSRGTGISFGIIAVICVIRILGFYLMPDSSNDFLQSGKFDGLMVMLLVGATTFLVFNLVLMVSRRLYVDAKAMENILNKNVMELQAVFKTTSVGFGILVNRVFKEVNDACCDMLGYSREEIIGKESRIFYPTQEEYEAIGKLYQIIPQLGSVDVEMRLLRKDGVVVNVIMGISAFDKNNLAQGVVLSLVNITKRKQLEEKSNYLATFPELNPNPILELDRDGNLKYQNPAAKNVFPDLENLGVNHPFLTGWTQIEKELQGTNWTKTFSREINVGNEWYEQIISPVTNNRIRIYARNITKRKQAEEAIVASEISYRRLFESAKDGILIIDAVTGSITDANPFLNNMLGLSLLEIKGKKLWEIGTFADIVSGKTRFEELLQKGYIRYEDLPLKTTDGRQISVEFVSIVYNVDHRRVIQCNIRDITERKRAEEALRQSEEKYRLIVENTLDIIFTTNSSEEYIYVSPSIKDILGYEPSELLGKPFTMIVHPDDLHIIREEIQITYDKEYKTSRESEYRLRHASGEWRWVVSRGTKVVDSNGRFLNFTGVIRDVTEHKKAEDKIMASLIEKETLLKEVHHRVKNNMQVISSLLRLQEGRVKDKDSAILLKDSQNRIQSMALVYNKLYQSNNLASINMTDYIKELTVGLVQSYAVSPTRVTVNVAPDEVLLSVDLAIPCGMVVNELVTNSLKYAFLENKKGQISLSLKENDNRELELVVSDNGAGMPDGIDLENGSTLGLKLVSNLVQNQLGGKIELDRSHGTAFRIIFPRAREEK